MNKSFEDAFDALLEEAFELYAQEEAEKLGRELESADPDSITFSKKFERKMNRLFRERFGARTIPHPDADTPYERARSRFIRGIRVLISRIKNPQKND